MFVIYRTLSDYMPCHMSCRSQSRIFFSHDQSAGQGTHGFVAMQRLAEVTGCAYNDHTSHLSLHPRYGPWFALEALIVFDGITYTGTRQHLILLSMLFNKRCIGMYLLH